MCCMRGGELHIDVLHERRRVAHRRAAGEQAGARELRRLQPPHPPHVALCPCDSTQGQPRFVSAPRDSTIQVSYFSRPKDRKYYWVIDSYSSLGQSFH
jgi:hypothetical protein